MRKYLPKLLALAGSAATLLIYTSPASAQTENSESKTRLLESYAKAYGVTPAESERRLRLQREIGKLGGQLKQDPNYAGHYIEHKPVYRVVAKFTQNAAAALAKYTTDPLWVAELAPVSYKELLQTQSTVYALLKGLGIESVSRENVETNKVEFFVLDPAAVQTLISTGALKVPGYVTFGKANISIRSERPRSKEDVGSSELRFAPVASRSSTRPRKRGTSPRPATAPERSPITT